MPEVRLIDANSLKHSRGIAGDEILHEIIDNQPTIEAEPVRHGRWILEREPDGTPYCLHCSECDPDFAVMYNKVATDYCPDCAAKMETDRVYERDDSPDCNIIARYHSEVDVDTAMQAFRDIPAVNSWISCSERMPENRCGVIFTVDRGHPFVCVGYRINSEREGLKLQRWFDKLSGLNFSDYDVKTWMPMPDAYVPPESEA